MMPQPCVAAVTLIALFTATTAGAQSASAAKTASRDCTGLFATSFPDARITSADAVAPNPDTIPVPHCKVLGVIGTEIRFQVLLPDSWNGRLLMGGNGGFAGSLDNDFSSVKLGYAFADTDTGHEASGIQASWALGIRSASSTTDMSPSIAQPRRPRRSSAPITAAILSTRTSGAARTVAARR